MICKPCPSLLYRIGSIFAFLEPEDNQILYAEMARMFIVSRNVYSSQCHLLSSSMATEVGLQEDSVNKDFYHSFLAHQQKAAKHNYLFVSEQ